MFTCGSAADLIRTCVRSSLFLWVCTACLAAESYNAAPLWDAAYRGDLAAVQRLVAAGADINAKNERGVTPLWMATGATPIFDPVRANPADLDTHVKLLARQTVVLRYLLDHGADPNLVATNGASPLMQAVRNANTESVRTLIVHSANVNAKDLHGGTALLDAVGYGFPDIVTILLEHGAQTNGILDVNGFTPLMLAIQQAHFGIAETLIRHGADVREPGRHGETALCLAVKKNRPELVRSLLAHGADAQARACDGNTPRQIAEQNRYTEIVRQLERAGASE